MLSFVHWMYQIKKHKQNQHKLLVIVIRVFQLTFLFKKDVKVYFTISHLHLLAR